MKTIRNYLVIILMFLMCYLAKGQDIRNTLAIYSDPVATCKDGFNIGIQFDYQRKYSFNRIELFTFPNLRGNNYTELSISHGLNKHIGIFNSHRIYGNIKGGIVKREISKYYYPLIGLQCGYEYYFNNGVFIGGRVGYDNRTDGKAEDTSLDSYLRENGYFYVGVTF